MCFSIFISCWSIKWYDGWLQLFFHKFFSRKVERERAKAAKASKRKDHEDSDDDDEEEEEGEEGDGDEVNETKQPEQNEDDDEEEGSDDEEAEIWKVIVLYPNFLLVTKFFFLDFI